MSDAKGSERDTADPGGSRPIQRAEDGFGPLLQRDYWAVVAGCRLDPVALIDAVSQRFCSLAPAELVTFEHSGGADPSRLDEGDELQVRIRLAGECRVRVVRREPQSLTLATLEGHPEAGRITFGAYRNPRDEVIFHIRSRARSSSAGTFLGFVMAGEAMQTNTWTDFIKAVAATFGDGVVGAVHADVLRDEESDAPESPCEPTFVATGE